MNHLINKAWRTSGEFTSDAQRILVVPGTSEGAYEIMSGGVLVKGER